MEVTIAKGGKFTFTITSKHLAKGLRASKRNPRNDDALITCIGAVGRDGVLQATEELARIASTVITDPFPYPQLFILTRVSIVCGLKTIYEWNGSTLTLKYTAAAGGSTWSVADYHDYIYLSNGTIAVVRSATDLSYSLSATLPAAQAICNYNGQTLIGAPA